MPSAAWERSPAADRGPPAKPAKHAPQPRKTEETEVLVKSRMSPFLPLATIRANPSSAADGRSSNVVALADAEEWIGHKFPILEDLSINRELAVGTWRLVLYRWDCPKCLALLETSDELRRGAPMSTRFACVSVSTDQRPIDRYVPGLARCLNGQLTDDRYSWVIPTPLHIDLQDGVVINVVRSD